MSTLLLDFDDTLHDRYSELDETRLGEPLPLARQACLLLERHHRLLCFSSRPVVQVAPWLRRHGFTHMGVTQIKQTGLIIDDRCLTFPGTWSEEFLQQVLEFKPWWARSPHSSHD